jgi:hypothetical protein
MDWVCWLMNNGKASGQITDMMAQTMQLRYRKYKKMKELWSKINVDFGKLVTLDGQHELDKLVLCVLVHSRRRLLRGVPSQFTEAHLP